MQQRPDLSRFREIPAFAQWRQRDMLEQVAKDLQEHDYGRFYGSAVLADEMRTDDRIAGVLSTRIGGFLSVPTTFKPANPKRKAAKLAELLGGADESEDDGLWPMICSQDAALVSRGYLNGGITLTGRLWTPEQWAQWQRVLPYYSKGYQGYMLLLRLYWDQDVIAGDVFSPWLNRYHQDDGMDPHYTADPTSQDSNCIRIREAGIR